MMMVHKAAIFRHPPGGRLLSLPSRVARQNVRFSLILWISPHYVWITRRFC